jgi:hypothetical protein
MLLCWWRRDTWILGFGPFPIVLSTNLFLWFKDDWFFLQFLLVSTGVLCNEFITWRRDRRRVHIFNPSAIALAIFSVGLLITQSTHITWGEEVAVTLGRPPNIYLEIFLLGLVVQALFSVTLVTLSSAVALYVLNLAYTGSTGVCLASLYFGGQGVPRDDARAVTLFRQSCATGWWRGCGGLAECYRAGRGTAADNLQAIEYFEKACRAGIAPSCYAVATMYRGMQDESLAQQRFRQACEFSSRYEETSAAYFRAGMVGSSGTAGMFCSQVTP